jgi:hypothetical protein
MTLGLAVMSFGDMSYRVGLPLGTPDAITGASTRR